MSQTKVVLITGGTSGIGFALAQHYGKNGWAVSFTGRDAARIEETLSQLHASGIEALGIKASAEVEQDQFRAVAETINRFGRIDVLINNAGISMRALFSELNLDVIRQVMEVNFFGSVYATKAALPYLLRSKGSIVGISSIAGIKGLPGRTGYSASKFALNGFLEALEIELLHKGVHVLVACPGFTASRIRENALTKTGDAQGQSPREEGRMMQPEEVAERIFDAVQQRKRLLVMTTEGKLTFWLNKFLPKVVNKLVFKAMAKEPDSGLS